MMKRRSVRAGAIVLVLAAAAVAVAAAAISRQASEQALPLQLVANVPLPGPSNRFDYTSLDPTTGKLYIAQVLSDGGFRYHPYGIPIWKGV